MRFLKVLLLIVVFAFGLLFFIQNGKSLETPLALTFSLYYGDFTWTGKELPFFVVILAAFVVGGLFATCFLLLDRIRLGCSLVKSKTNLRSAEKEIARLRASMEKEVKPIEAPSQELKQELPQSDPQPA